MFHVIFENFDILLIFSGFIIQINKKKKRGIILYRKLSGILLFQYAHFYQFSKHIFHIGNRSCNDTLAVELCHFCIPVLLQTQHSSKFGCKIIFCPKFQLFNGKFLNILQRHIFISIRRGIILLGRHLIIVRSFCINLIHSLNDVIKNITFVFIMLI